MFNQEAIKVDDVARELEAAREAIGSGLDVRAFAVDALAAYGAAVGQNGVTKFDLAEVPLAAREMMGLGGTTQVRATFELPAADGVEYLSRTHPLVEGLAAHVMDAALDPLIDKKVARRAGVVRTRAVSTRTTLLLLRFRFHIVSTTAGDTAVPLLAEDTAIVAFEGSPDQARWIDRDAAERLLTARPEANVHPQQAAQFVRMVVEGIDGIMPHLVAVADDRAGDLLDAHRRVRQAANLRGVRQRVEPKGQPDVLGIYVFLPVV